ncbi:uncharacterized protein LOC113357931 isoform X3 [Papaver somniferum]|uniref:uncharacterized protein LOC113357931 isoform X3 n=1 Tax=Papaver somniferum TaxID=3469 RepID=UPI000E6FCF15|nr:uncharacterized protein LOC113357931 isoform X3 [Papaver somniferum]
MEIDESNNETGKETPMDQQDNIDNLEVNEGNESKLISSTDEEISDYKDSPKHSEDTWDVNLKVDLNLSSLESDGEVASFSQAIQSPCCNQMERLSNSSANTSIHLNQHASEEMNGDVIDFVPDLAKIFSEDQVEMLQRTRDNEGEVFEDFTDTKDYLQINPGFEYMANSKWQCSSSSYNEQSLPCADLGEGSKSMEEKGI